MKRKKMMSLLLSAVAAVSMIAGCGNQAAGTSGEGTAPTSESREAGTMPPQPKKRAKGRLSASCVLISMDRRWEMWAQKTC